MIKWLFSVLAFLILAVSISAFTMNVFISEVDASFESAKANALEKNDAILNQTINDFYSNLDESQKKTIADVEAMTSDLRKTVLGPQCMNENMKTQFFCDERFIKGELSFDAVMRESIDGEVDSATFQAMEAMHEKLVAYQKFNLILIGIMCAVVSFLMYVLLAGSQGLKKFFGSAVWISVFSAISFKLMPATINNLVSVATQGGPANEAATFLMKQITSEWIVPAMNSAFIVSIWLAVISFVVWLILKLFIENEVSVS